MAAIFIIFVILGCVGYQYQKGKLIKAVTGLVVVICSSIAALNYFELLANVVLTRNDGESGVYEKLAPWAQPISFLLLFIIVFAILQTIVDQLLKKPGELGNLPDRIGRGVCGIFLGIVVSGVLLTAAAMSPLPNKYPYQRFDENDPNPKSANKVLLNADGFVTGWFDMVSRGCFSGKKSFAVLHPNFLDQTFLNRHSVTDEVPAITTKLKVIEPLKKDAISAAPENLKDADNPEETIAQSNGRTLTIVRIGIKKLAYHRAGPFTGSQLRLICKPQNPSEDRFAGKAQNVYPVGYLKTPDTLQKQPLSSKIELKSDDFDGSKKYIDFAFYVPNNFVPVLIEFKQNEIIEVPLKVDTEQSS